MPQQLPLRMCRLRKRVAIYTFTPYSMRHGVVQGVRATLCISYQCVWLA
jgi:hypothetical protein